MNPPMELKLAEVYMLLGERDVVIYQLGEQFNRIAAENDSLKKRIQELESGKLGHSDKHLELLHGSRPPEGNLGGRWNAVPGEPHEPTPGVDEMEPVS